MVCQYKAKQILTYQSLKNQVLPLVLGIFAQLLLSSVKCAFTVTHQQDLLLECFEP